MFGTYNHLHLTILLTDTEREKHQGYKYLVRSDNFSHTAFITKSGLKQWMTDRGLKIGSRIYGRRSTSVFIIGEYKQVSEMINNDKFFSKHAGLKPTTTLCNGRRVIAFIGKEYCDHEVNNQYAIPTIYVQNPNTDQFVLDYQRYPEGIRTSW